MNLYKLSSILCTTVLLIVSTTGCGKSQTMFANDGAKKSPGASKSVAGNADPTGSSGGVGRTGSTARFSVLNDRLYTLNSGRIIAFDISSPDKPLRAGSSRVASDIETLYNDGKNLFIGAETALYIYSVKNPNQPSLVGIHSHQRACDPVVTAGNFAFVTLKSGASRCSGNTNVLKVIDIRNPHRPIEIKRIDMFRPSGLGVANDRLFVCDGEEGLAEFDISRPTETRELSRARDEVCSDVIPLEKTLITTGPNGISQYDLSNDSFVYLSRIEAQR